MEPMIHPMTPKAVWFTGLSGAGKTTLATALSKNLTDLNIAHRVLDGDELRKTLCADLGFSKHDREKNVQRVAELAYTLQQQGIVTIISLISPYRAVRNEAIKKLQAIEVYLQASLEVLKARDPKGLYAKALAGELSHFTGISDPYEEPLKPAVSLRTDILTVEQCLTEIMRTMT